MKHISTFAKYPGNVVFLILSLLPFVSITTAIVRKSYQKQLKIVFMFYGLVFCFVFFHSVEPSLEKIDRVSTFKTQKTFFFVCVLLQLGHRREAEKNEVEHNNNHSKKEAKKKQRKKSLSIVGRRRKSVK